MARNGLHARSLVGLALGVVGLALAVAPVAATAPTFESVSDGPFDDVLADCGDYEVREVSTFSATIISFSDGTTRVLAFVDGWLYRTDDPGTILGRERARSVRTIDGTVAMVTGNRWHIGITGDGMSAHDAGRLVFDFDTREVFALSGTHQVFDGEFDFATLCDL